MMHRNLCWALQQKLCLLWSDLSRKHSSPSNTCSDGSSLTYWQGLANGTEIHSQLWLSLWLLPAQHLQAEQAKDGAQVLATSFPHADTCRLSRLVEQDTS
mmetsp:Transcript_128752/g.412470  ORF Transcript_128752/g.412470 Transcript_128752/m.412470 type:complete len:100 (-) Transcript_128752:63-362(-)